MKLIVKRLLRNGFLLTVHRFSYVIFDRPTLSYRPSCSRSLFHFMYNALNTLFGKEIFAGKLFHSASLQIFLKNGCISFKKLLSDSGSLSPSLLIFRFAWNVEIFSVNILPYQFNDIPWQYLLCSSIAHFALLVYRPHMAFKHIFCYRESQWL